MKLVFRSRLLNLTASKPSYNHQYAQLVLSPSVPSGHSVAPRGGQRKANLARSRKASPSAGCGLLMRRTQAGSEHQQLPDSRKSRRRYGRPDSRLRPLDLRFGDALRPGHEPEGVGDRHRRVLLNHGLEDARLVMTFAAELADRVIAGISTRASGRWRSPFAPYCVPLHQLTPARR